MLFRMKEELFWMVGKNGFFSSAAMGERGREIFKSDKKATPKNFNFLLLYMQLLKLKYIMLCGYDEYNKYSVSTERTA